MKIINEDFINNFLSEISERTDIKKKDNSLQEIEIKEQISTIDNKKNNIPYKVATKTETSINDSDVKITLKEQWCKTLKSLKLLYGNSSFNSWLAKLSFIEYRDKTIFTETSTAFIRDYITLNYSDKILNRWNQVSRENATEQALSLEILINKGINSNNVQNIDIDIQESNTHTHDNISNTSSSIAYNTPYLNNENENKVDNFKQEQRDGLSFKLNPRFTFDSFIVDKSNVFACEATKIVAESRKPAKESNPLFLYGGVGLGKTHLMHAIAWHIKNKFEAKKVIYMSAEKFMYQYIISLKDKKLLQFKQYLREADILMIDDFQFISGKDSTQEEFFHTFNALIDKNKQLVISADRSPTDLNGVEERIKSRLGWGLVADINPTTFELRLGILHSKVEHMNVNIPKKVIEFIAKNIMSNVRELEGALNKVIAHSALIGNEITVDSAKEILSDLLRASEKSTTVDDIINKVAEFFNLKVIDMISPKRNANISIARQIAMFLAKKHTTSSLPAIGKKFGGRDHTTVIHAIRKIEEMVNHDTTLANNIQIITKKLK